jgi:hypothetical protein
MARTIDAVYQSIAQNMVDAIPKSWNSSLLDVEFNGDSAEFDATFETSDGQTEDFDVEYQVFKDFKELYSIMTEEGDHHKWNRATFKLTPDNKFSIDFDWDQELADEVAHLNS